MDTRGHRKNFRKALMGRGLFLGFGVRGFFTDFVVTGQMIVRRTLKSIVLFAN